MFAVAMGEVLKLSCDEARAESRDSSGARATSEALRIELATSGSREVHATNCAKAARHIRKRTIGNVLRWVFDQIGSARPDRKSRPKKKKLARLESIARRGCLWLRHLRNGLIGRRSVGRVGEVLSIRF